MAFPDDDATFQPGALADALRLTEEPLDLFSGQIVDGMGKAHLIAWLTAEAEITSANVEQCLVESSFFIQRDVFLSVGGFDPLFGPGGQFPAAEGADLMRRLWIVRNHLRTRYTPSIRIYHPDKLRLPAAKAEALRERIYDFACAEGAFTARYSQVLPLGAIATKLLFRFGGACIYRGERRRRNIAFLTGFCSGYYRYLCLRRKGESVHPAQDYAGRQAA